MFWIYLKYYKLFTGIVGKIKQNKDTGDIHDYEHSPDKKIKMNIERKLQIFSVYS